MKLACEVIIAQLIFKQQGENGEKIQIEEIIFTMKCVAFLHLFTDNMRQSKAVFRREKQLSLVNWLLLNKP